MSGRGHVSAGVLRVPHIVMDCERDDIDQDTKERGAGMIVAAILEAGFQAKWYLDDDGEPRVLHQAPDEVFRKAQYLAVVAQRLPFTEVRANDEQVER